MFNDILSESAAKSGNLLCMGLDPVLEFLPAELKSMGPAGIPVYFEVLFRELKNRNLLPAAFKANQGYYLIYDDPMKDCFDGSKALAKTISLIRNYFPGIPVILDFKRGDIASSSANYAREGFHIWQCDAVTVSPYMGRDSVSPFLQYSRQSKGTYILNRTSNPGAADLQSIDISNKDKLYIETARKIIEWNKDFSGAGAVVGATSPDELSVLAAIYAPARIPLLIPGVGSQGGSAETVIQRLHKAAYPLELARINSSSGITHPWAKQNTPAPPTWAEIAADEAGKLIRSLNINQKPPGYA